MTLEFHPGPRRGGAAGAARQRRHRRDGIHSVLRRQLYPNEGDPKYTGYNMWRGVTRWPPILGGASMTRAGWLKNGKMVLDGIPSMTTGRNC